MRSLKLAWRGPMLMAFPLLCQGILIFAVIFMLVGAKQSIERASHMRDVLFRFNHVCTEFLDILVFQDEKFREVRRGDPTKFSTFVELDSLVKELPAQGTENLRFRLKELLAVVNNSVTQFAPQQSNKEGRRQDVFKRSFRVIPPFLEELHAVIEKNTNLGQVEFDKSVHIKDEILRYISIAIIVSLLVAAAMFVLFTVSIKRPIQHIAENSRRLSKKIVLEPQLRGNDELSKLDKSLHLTFDAVVLASERELALINNVSDLVCSLNQEGVFLEANAAAMRMLGLTMEELIGKSIADIAVVSQSLLAEEFLRKACQPGEAHNFELKLQTVRGSEIETHWSAIWSPLRHRVFCVIRDITAEKALSRMKQDFIDMVSHDLRSPLTSLGITLELIENSHKGEINPAVLEELQATNKNVQVLVSFINDLLDFQKLDEGRVQLDKCYCSINEIIKEAISLTKDFAAAKQIGIEYSAHDFEVFCDPIKITQALLNLLTNAIKFSPEGGAVKISIQKAEGPEESTLVKLMVSDNGPGIPKELRERIFQPFEQAPSHKHQGTGLGLSICKMIVDNHGGDIGVTENEDGTGSTFWFTLATSDFISRSLPPAPTNQNLFLD